MFDFSSTKRWKILLMVGAVLISLLFLFFTNYLVRQLSKKDLAEVHKVVDAFKKVNDPTVEDYTEVLNTIRSATIPIIVVDEHDSIINDLNLDPNKRSDYHYKRRELREMRFFNNPILIEYNPHKFHKVYYKEQQAITLLRFFPYVQLLLLGLFLSLSYFAFNTNRLYEQNKLWVGMAKETAHQIGTPLSSLIAWVEYMRTLPQPPPNEVLDELEKDVQRLEIITERFSKIGSTPELEPQNVAAVVSETVDYLRGRISKRVNMTVHDDSGKSAIASINKNLFSWVIENIAKNAVDAMQGVGNIDFRVSKHRRNINIDIRDSGKGIAKANWNVIFEPGYTTRKRGWGLGLSLARRIIINYHKGEIYVKESDIGKGTTFRIRLEAVNNSI